MPNEDLKQLGEEWSIFFRWTVSISIFLITASLTVLTFQKCIGIYNRIFVYATLGILLINIFLSWRLLLLNLFVLKTKADHRTRGGQFKSKKEEEKFKKADPKATKLQICVYITFSIGILLFIAFLISYIH